MLQGLSISRHFTVITKMFFSQLLVARTKKLLYYVAKAGIQNYKINSGQETIKPQVKHNKHCKSQVIDNEKFHLVKTLTMVADLHLQHFLT